MIREIWGRGAARTFLAQLAAVLVLSTSVCLGQTALVNRAPQINGLVEGSVQQRQGEAPTLNGGAHLTNDLLVPGTPTVRINGQPVYAGIIDGSGATAPANYQITLNSGVRLRNIVRRTSPASMPVLTAPPLPAGTRDVTLSVGGQPGNFGTLRNLTLNSNAGLFLIPPGTYGDFAANGGGGFQLGIAGATTPSVYNFQRLTLNSNCHFHVLGPVIVNVAWGFSQNGVMGTASNPGWLALNIYSGGVTVALDTLYAAKGLALSAAAAAKNLVLWLPSAIAASISSWGIAAAVGVAAVLAAVAANNFAEGGYVSGPGTGTSDSIPARLSNGEFVMPAAAVQRIGLPTLEAMRFDRPVAGFAAGGVASTGGSSRQASSSSGNRPVNINLLLTDQELRTRMFNEESDAYIVDVIRRNRWQLG